jgi:hypothetical protein
VKDKSDIFSDALRIGGHVFSMGVGDVSDSTIVLIRIMPTTNCPLAFCTPELLKYNQEWTPLDHQRWLREQGKKNGKETKT